MTPEQQQAVADWQTRVERHVAKTGPGIARGGGRGPRSVATEAWRCEGAWQCDEQMDIWQCLDEVELDAMRERDQDDDETDTDEHEEQA